MDKAKRERLEAKGWKLTSVAEFLGLTPDETAPIDARIAMGATLLDDEQPIASVDAPQNTHTS